MKDIFGKQGRFLGKRKSITIFLLLIGSSIIFTLLSPNYSFISYLNLEHLLMVGPIICIISTGVALLLISGEFDLALGSYYALSGILLATFYTQLGINIFVCIFLVLAIGSILGGLDGVMVTKFRLNSFVVTLATMWMYRGVTLVVSDGRIIPFNNEISKGIFASDIGGVPLSFIWLMILATLAFILLEHTKFGNWIVSVGSNKEAAQMMGINPSKVKIICFMIVGASAALAGIIETTRLGVAIPTLGMTIILNAYAGAIVGGTLLSGGVGTIAGAVMGGFLIQILYTGLIMIGATAFFFKIFLGVVLLAGVLVNMILRQRMSS